jgi:hypothetical protein
MQNDYRAYLHRQFLRHWVDTAHDLEGDVMTDDLVKKQKEYISYYQDQTNILLTRVAQLEAALAEAIEDIQHWGGYAGEYFQDKWDLKGNIAKHRAALGEKKDG